MSRHRICHKARPIPLAFFDGRCQFKKAFDKIAHRHYNREEPSMSRILYCVEYSL